MAVFNLAMVVLNFLVFSTNLSCLYMITILDKVEQASCHISAKTNFVSKLCSGTHTLTLIEYGFCRSSIKSNSLDPFKCKTVNGAQCMLYMALCVAHGVVRGEKVEEAGDRPYLV